MKRLKRKRRKSMSEDIKVGDMIEVTEIKEKGYPFFKVGDKGKVVFIGSNKIACDFNQPGQTVYEDGHWAVGLFEGGSKCKKIEKKSPERGIRIKVEKYEDERGNRLIKVLGITALKHDDLPFNYLRGDHIRLDCDGSILWYKKEGNWLSSALLESGGVYLQNDFEACMEIIKWCGVRLGEINKKNQMKKKVAPPPVKKRVWSGEKEYVI
jgi:hypothetical protein